MRMEMSEAWRIDVDLFDISSSNQMIFNRSKTKSVPFHDFIYSLRTEVTKIAKT